jgi:hypothetical protein
MAHHDILPYAGPMEEGPLHNALIVLYHLDGALQDFPAWDEATHGMSQALGLQSLQDSLDTLRRELDPAHFSVSAEWAQACGLIGALAATLEEAPLELALAPLRARVTAFLDWAKRLDSSLEEPESRSPRHHPSGTPDSRVLPRPKR